MPHIKSIKLSHMIQSMTVLEQFYLLILHLAED